MHGFYQGFGAANTDALQAAGALPRVDSDAKERTLAGALLFGLVKEGPGTRHRVFVQDPGDTFYSGLAQTDMFPQLLYRVAENLGNRGSGFQLQQLGTHGFTDSVELLGDGGFFPTRNQDLAGPRRNPVLDPVPHR